MYKKRNTGKSIEKSSSHRSVTEIADFANQYDRSAKCCVHLDKDDGDDDDAGWQKLHGSTGGTRRKVWTQTKILSPNIRYFVAN